MAQLQPQSWKDAAIAGAAAGLAVAAVMMCIAWQHNPQGEFHDEAGVHWFNWFAIGVSWLVAVAPPVALVFGLVSAIARRVLPAA